MGRKRIGFLAQDMRKPILYDFCAAYSGYLKQHELVATGRTGVGIESRTELSVRKLLAGSMGGGSQLLSELQLGNLDILIFFRTPDDPHKTDLNDKKILDECDRQNIPVATNFSTAEGIMYALIHGIYDIDMDMLDSAMKKSK